MQNFIFKLKQLKSNSPHYTGITTHGMLLVNAFPACNYWNKLF